MYREIINSLSEKESSDLQLRSLLLRPYCLAGLVDVGGLCGGNGNGYV